MSEKLYKLAKLIAKLQQYDLIKEGQLIELQTSAQFPVALEYSSFGSQDFEFEVKDDYIECQVKDLLENHLNNLEVRTLNYFVNEDGEEDFDIIDGVDDDVVALVYQGVVNYKNQIIQKISSIEDSKAKIKDSDELDKVRALHKELIAELNPTPLTKLDSIDEIKEELLNNHKFEILIKLNSPLKDTELNDHNNYYIDMIFYNIETDDIDFIDDVTFNVEYELLDEDQEFIPEEKFLEETGLDKTSLFAIMNRQAQSVQIFLHDLILDDLIEPDEEEHLGLVDSKPKIKDCADNSGKKFVKYRYDNSIWVDVKDDEHLLSTSTAYETMAQNKKKAIGNIKYQIKMKNNLPNSAKILMLEGKVKEVKSEQLFYADNTLKEGKKMIKTKDSFAFVTPTEESIVKKISDVTGKDLGNMGINFYIIKGQNFDEEDYSDYGNEGYEDLISRTKEAMEYDRDEARTYDYSKNLESWIDSKASEMAGKLCDECEIEEENWNDVYETIRTVLKESFPVKSFYGDCNGKKVCDAKPTMNDGALSYRGYTLIYSKDGKYLIINPDGNVVKEIENDNQFEGAVDYIIAKESEEQFKDESDDVDPMVNEDLVDTAYILATAKEYAKYGSKINLNGKVYETSLDGARYAKNSWEKDTGKRYVIIGNKTKKIYDSKAKLKDSSRIDTIVQDYVIDEYKDYILYPYGSGYIVIDPKGDEVAEFDDADIDSFREMVDSVTSTTGKEEIINI